MNRLLCVLLWLFRLDHQEGGPRFWPLRRRDVYIDGKFTFRRYFLTPRWLPLRVFLHDYRVADRNRDKHDHPWSFLTLVCKGWYNEEHGGGWKYGPGEDLLTTGSVRFRPAEHTHRITDVAKGGYWSLVVAGPARRVWGFRTEQGWKPWREYLSLPPDAPDSAEDVVRWPFNRRTA